MSPILVRPVREQFEHDRIIRVLQAKYKRKYEVAINPGAEQNAAVGIGNLPMYPDLVLFSPERSRKVQGTVEVETTESVNTLEAMAQWGPFSRLRAAFFLYVPVNTIDNVRRLCTEYNISPAEIWTYHAAIDQVRFTMVHRSPDAPKVAEARVKPDRPAPDPPAAESRKRKVETRATKANIPKPKGKPKPARKAAAPKKASKPARPAAKAKKPTPKKRRRADSR
ncbi:MAG TPA: hypothetical protein VMO26_27470 [Vicinamibacterales bacterium]|nr:hypothetical protein [Vicinamibacterales bacterium]